MAILAVVTETDVPRAVIALAWHVAQARREGQRGRTSRSGVDVALAVFDEMDWMAVLDVPLLVAAQPTYAMGRMAAELLFARMDDAARPAQDVVIAATIHDGAAARPVANGLPVAPRAADRVPLPR